MSKSDAQSSTNAKLLSVIAENGTEFRPNQKIIYNLDPSIGWIKTKESYLVFDILNYSTSNMRLMLGEAGISSIIKRVDIYSRESGLLLETLQDYNKWTATQMQYANDDKTNIINMEGVPAPSNQSKSAIVAAPRVYRPSMRKFWSEPANGRCSPMAGGVADGDIISPAYTSVRFITPLRCGIFREWDDEKLIPVLMLGGLRVEITLAPPSEAWTTGETGIVNRVVNNYSDTVDSNGSPSPFALNKIGFSGTGGAGQCATTDNGFTMLAPCRAGDCPFAVGNKVVVTGFNGATAVSSKATTANLTITQVERVDAGNTIKITTSATLGGATAITSALTISYDMDLITDADVDYRITNCEFRIMREDPPNVPMKNTEYIYTTYDLFRDTIPQNQVNFTTDITSTSSQALSMFTMYENPSETDAHYLGLNNYYQGLTAGETGFSMNSVVYFINNKLYPLRAYDPRTVGDKVITQNELVKAWGTLNIVPKCLGSATSADSTIYTNRFLHARELARGQAVFNLQNAEPQIRMTFVNNRSNNGCGRAITSSSVFTFCFSKRTLKIDGDSGLTLLQ
tara:strand:+ start:1339 stop:3045 length:1707 start_codon:yes stop_codon:yes gene_type:complete